MLCLAVVAGCGSKEEPTATSDQSATQNPPAPTPNEPVVSAPDTPDSVPAAVVRPAEPVEAQVVQMPPTMPPLPTKLGDPAFPLMGLTTVKGDPVEITPGKVYVVEFWATWCPPCKDSIPHLTALSKKFEDDGVVVIGITNEDVGTVEPFVSDMGTKMDYNVAIDALGGVSAGYMMAFKQNGIPTAFIVDKEGRIVWYGHPLGDLDRVLSQVVAGTYEIPS